LIVSLFYEKIEVQGRTRGEIMAYTETERTVLALVAEHFGFPMRFASDQPGYTAEVCRRFAEQRQRPTRRELDALFEELDARFGQDDEEVWAREFNIDPDEAWAADVAGDAAREAELDEVNATLDAWEAS
jgi:hypothetical protein